MLCGVVITISPFIVFALGMLKFLDGLGFIGKHRISLESAAPENIFNGWCAFAIAINESNYICPIGVAVLLVCLAIYTSIKKEYTSIPEIPKPESPTKTS